MNNNGAQHHELLGLYPALRRQLILHPGHTDNLEQRIGEHQNGLCGGYTASRLPVELMFSQACSTREEALAAEQQIKGWNRKKKEAMMRGDWAEVSRLAKCR